MLLRGVQRVAQEVKPNSSIECCSHWKCGHLHDRNFCAEGKIVMYAKVTQGKKLVVLLLLENRTQL